MKFLLSLSFLLFAAASSNASSFAEASTAPDDPILDATDAPLQFGVPYYMAPAIWAWGGGVSLAYPTPSQPCPKVIQLTIEIDNGTPVVFTSAVQNVTGNITIGSEFIINFYNLTRPNAEYCGESNLTTWGTTRTWKLAVGGEEMRTVFKLSGVGHSGVPDTYLLKPVSPLDLVVGFGENGLMVVPYDGEFNLSFVFRKAKAEEDEDDMVIQLPRKLSV